VCQRHQKPAAQVSTTLQMRQEPGLLESMRCWVGNLLAWVCL